ncbi:MAG: glycosyltransferase family 39 protein [Vulcanimicrobiaceae bacterium]
MAAFALHLFGAARYGFFRDELYFIACAQHLAWGYVDQPPFVAVASALAAPFHYSLIAVRLTPCIAAALTVYAVCFLARDLGAGRFGQVLAGVAVLFMPANLALGSMLATTSFEPLTWTCTILAAMRILTGGGARAWTMVACIVAAGFYAKYTIVLLAVALLIGILLTRERRVLRTPWLGVASALLLILVAPNIIWQMTHHLPFLEVLHGDAVKRHALQNGLQTEFRNTWHNAIAFFTEQVLYTGPLTTPLWLLGLWFFWRRRSEFRSIVVTYVFLLGVCVAVGAKGYYVIGIYPVLVSAGAVWLDSLLGVQTIARSTVLAAVIALGLFLTPLSMAVLPLQRFVQYSQMLHLTGHGKDAHLIQPLYADEFGWRGTAEHVAAVYNALPPVQRAKTAIYADTYGYAGALNLYGPKYGLPTPLGGQNTFWLWGTHGYDGSSVIAVGATQYHLFVQLFKSVKQVDLYTNPNRWVLEGPLPIYLCTQPIAPLATMWPRFRYYGP